MGSFRTGRDVALVPYLPITEWSEKPSHIPGAHLAGEIHRFTEDFSATQLVILANLGGANRGLRSLISTRIHRDTRAERSGYPKGKLCVTFGINVYLKTRWFARNLKSRQCGSISLQAFVVPSRGRWRRLDAGRGVPRFLTDWRLLANVQEPEQSPTVLSKLFTSRTTNDSLSRVRVGRGHHG